MSNVTQAEIIAMMQNFNQNDWAESSKFYGKVMGDGNIFNPYIHRRWIPAQFRRLYYRYSWDASGKAIDRIRSRAISNYSDRIFKIMCEEIRVLSFLEERDKLAFDERKLIWKFDTCKFMMSELLRVFQEYRKIRNHFLYFNGMTSDTWDMVCNEWEQNLEPCTTYKDLYEFMTKENYYRRNRKEKTFVDIAHPILSYATSHGATFTGTFKPLLDMLLLNGAYYAYKADLMFTVNVDSRQARLEMLLKDLQEGKTWEYFTEDMLKEFHASHW